MYLDDILSMENLSNLSQTQLIQIVNILQNEVKKLNSSKDWDRQKLVDTIQVLNDKNKSLEIINDKYKKSVLNYHNILKRNLTVKERVLGKFNPNLFNNIDDGKAM